MDATSRKPLSLPPWSGPCRARSLKSGKGEEIPCRAPRKEVGRHRLRYDRVFNKGGHVLGEDGEDLRARERWELLYRTTYTVAVGRRFKRVREMRRQTQSEALARVRRPNGRGYSRAFLSCIEAGYANSPLDAYIHLAEGYDLDVARLLGPEEAEKPVSEAEMTLIRFLRRLGVSPDEAMARLTRR